MNQSDKTDELYKALDTFHQKSNLVKATKENPFLKNKYADYNMIVAGTRSDLIDAGLRVKQSITSLSDKTAIRTRLTHVPSQQFMEDVAPVESKPSDPQSQGSGITYQKRYSYVAMLDLLVDKDDDGNLAAGLGKAAEKSAAVEKALLQIEKSNSSEALQKVWVALGTLTANKEVFAAKEAKKMEFTT